MTLSKELLPHQEHQPSWNQVVSAGGMARDLMGSPSTHGHQEEVWCGTSRAETHWLQVILQELVKKQATLGSFLNGRVEVELYQTLK